MNQFLCNYHQSAFQDEADLGGIDSDKTIAVTFKVRRSFPPISLNGLYLCALSSLLCLQHEEELSEKKEATFQAALLYTTKDGERRVRGALRHRDVWQTLSVVTVFNASLPTSNAVGTIFRHADMDATTVLLARQVRIQCLCRIVVYLLLRLCYTSLRRRACQRSARTSRRV